MIGYLLFNESRNFIHNIHATSMSDVNENFLSLFSMLFSLERKSIFHFFYIFDKVFRNYTKLTMLAISQKELPLVDYLVINSDVFLTELTWHCS